MEVIYPEILLAKNKKAQNLKIFGDYKSMYQVKKREK